MRKLGNTFYFEWEIVFMEWVQSFESKPLIGLAQVFTMLGEEILVLFLVGLFYWSIDKELGRKVAFAMSGVMISGTLLKSAVLRRRPYMDHERVKCLRAPHQDGDVMSPAEQGYSMPSLHSGMAVSMYGTTARNRKNKVTIVIAVLLPVFIGLSRIFLGVHYPTDVLSGWLFGTISLFLLGSIEEKYGYKIGFGVVLAVGLIGFFYCRDTEFFSAYGVVLGLLIGFSIEEKYVKFENNDKWWSYVARPVLGVIVFLIIKTLLKLPVSNLSLEETSLFMLFYRLFRYTVSTAVTIGVYPMLFRKKASSEYSNDK